MESAVDIMSAVVLEVGPLSSLIGLASSFYPVYKRGNKNGEHIYKEIKARSEPSADRVLHSRQQAACSKVQAKRQAAVATV